MVFVPSGHANVEETLEGKRTSQNGGNVYRVSRVKQLEDRLNVSIKVLSVFTRELENGRMIFAKFIITSFSNITHIISAITQAMNTELKAK